MHKKLLALGAVFAVALLAWAMLDSAEARRGGGGGGGFRGGGGGHFRGFSGGGFRFHGGPRRFGRAAGFAAVPFAAYGGYRVYNGYYGGCYWLKERAAYTGSRYWWNRYYACVNGYGY